MYGGGIHPTCGTETPTGFRPFGVEIQQPVIAYSIVLMSIYIN